MKNFYRLLLTSSFFFCTIATSFSQQTEIPIKELKVGDKIPDFILTNLLHTNRKSVKLSSLYNGGLLIINFWASWCIPCIRQLPEFNDLKLKHSTSFNMICLTYQDKKEISDFIEKTDIGNFDSLMISTNDTKLAKYFPHQIIPHNIWIDKKGVIRAITGDDAVTEKNISDVIAMKQVSVQTKVDEDFNWQKPLHVEDSAFIYRSILTKAKPKIGNGGVWLQSIEGPDRTYIKRYLAWNRLCTDFFWVAYKHSQNPNWKEIEIHTADSNKFIYPITRPVYQSKKYASIEDWSLDNQYCYELTLPYGAKDSVFFQYMVEDLKRFFKVELKIENRNIDCWVGRKISGKNILSRSEKDSSFIVFTSDSLVVSKTTINDFLKYAQAEWNGNSGLEPLINESEINYPVDFTINFDELKGLSIPIDFIFKKMITWGIEFKKEIRSYPILVLYDKK